MQKMNHDTHGNQLRSVNPITRLVLSSFVLSAILVVAAQAQIRLEFPSQDPGVPAYARVERGFGPAPHTSELAAIVFYRSPECVPAGFDLLNFYDIPGAFFCPLTVEGFVIYKNGPPPIDLAPMQAVSSGSGAVPVWFVSWEELQAAVADDVLTITELEAMASLQKGSATLFRETLHPSSGAQNYQLTMNASGTLEDGRRFRLHHIENPRGTELSTRIVIE